MPARRPNSRPPAAQHDGLFAWTIGILLLAGFALACWIGSFYVFGHPEKALSYGLLRKLDKLDPPRRFELTAAPRGEFLDADKILKRFGTLAPRELEDENNNLLRAYLRNYYQSKDLVPYIIGSFNVMGAFRLGPSNFFPSGVVALARSKQNPNVMLEMVFPAAEADLPKLERMLVAGLDLDLVRTLDLTAVINARSLPDGTLMVTAVPLLYGHYTSSGATGTFSLEPPSDLNVGAGLPVLNAAAVEEAAKHHQSVAQGAAATPPNSLMRVQPTEAVDPANVVPVARAEPVKQGPVGVEDGVPVARAVPVSTPETVRVARALPVNVPPAAVPVATPVPAAAAELQPFAAATPVPPVAPAVPAAPAAVPTPAGRDWTVYEPGRMPRGRLVDLEAARGMAGATTEGVSYLAGDFQVSASGQGRAVLRGSGGQQNIRVVVDFPPGSSPPPQGESVSRDAQRPFQITSVERGADGQINVYVREVTRP
jgi:hypothetical protein